MCVCASVRVCVFALQTFYLSAAEDRNANVVSSVCVCVFVYLNSEQTLP